MPKFDPLAPVGSWAIEVELAGTPWTVPAAPASDWLLAVLGDHPESLLDMLTGNTAPLEDALYYGDLTWPEIEVAYHQAIEAVSGVKWWEAQRLLALALDWEGTGGELLLRGIRLEEHSVAQICVIVWRCITRNVEEKELNKILHEIEKPPPGVDYDEVIDDEANLKAFGSIPSD